MRRKRIKIERKGTKIKETKIPVNSIILRAV